MSGDLFMALSPIAMPRPSIVTRPTPSPPLIYIFLWLLLSLTLAINSMPLVMSGSSPASFITLTDTVSLSTDTEFISISNGSPDGSLIKI